MHQRTAFYLFRPLFCLVVTCFSHIAIGQINTFKPSVCDSVLLAERMKGLEQKVTADKKELNDELKKEIAKIYDESLDNVKSVLGSKQILTDAEAVQYITGLTQKLVNSNAYLKTLPLQVYLSRSAAFNAFSTREGVIVFYGGLFAKLKTEGQVAFVLSHEIAHVYLEHAKKSFHKYVNSLYSKEVQEELKRIKKTEYQKRQQIEALSKGISFDNRRHSRGNETEADSLAVAIMHAAGYPVQDAMDALAILDVIDKDSTDMAATLNRNFNSAKYPFKSKWLYKETGLLGGHADLEVDKELQDSLKTHPDCQLRIGKIQSWLPKYSSQQTSVYDTAKFHQLQSRMLYESVHYYLSSQNYGPCLQLALSGLALYPKDAYLITSVGRCFNGMYDARKKHVLGKLVPLPSPDYPAAYNTLLQFIENLYPEEMAAVGYYFLEQHADSCAGDKDYDTAKKYAAANL